jgi:putative membrane protein
VVPFCLVAVWHAVRGHVDRHVRIVRWLWPVWMYVSVTGVLIYLMLHAVPVV